MEIVIEIPENVYQFVMNTSFVEDERSIFTQSKEDRKKTMILFDILDAIRNGTPLPKGHGRLIDADDIDYIADFMGNWTSEERIKNTSPTIIEADGGGAENDTDNDTNMACF